jgi:predicted enzyme related to lactoylglutathione lyase
VKFEPWMPCTIVLSFVLGMVLQSARGSGEATDATRVTGAGGFFFKAQNPRKLGDWYRTHLGIALVPAGKGENSPQFYSFHWREKDHPETIGATAFSIFPANTKHFGSSSSSFMLNFRVANLERLLAQLKREGVQVDDKIVADESSGRFAHATDLEGNRIELWEPKGQ